MLRLGWRTRQIEDILALNMKLSYLILLQATIYSLLLPKIETATGINSQEFRTYIVHTNRLFDDNTLLLSQEHIEKFCFSKSLLQESNKPCVLHWFDRIMSGFTARMTVEHARELEKKHGIVSLREENVYTMQTTHTPEFLGLHQNIGLGGLWGRSPGVYGDGIVIGVLDSGLTPNHPSFNDDGMPPPPSKWKGTCVGGVACNNKIIGARDLVYESGVAPVVDLLGHGTHTSSIAGGNFVENANVFGQAKGTAVGIAPRAHLAIYKVCDRSNICYESDIAIAMELAINDGVDVLSVSIGTKHISAFYDDLFVIGSLAAIQQGILVSCSASNRGPKSETVSHAAPWILTVGATTVDRSFRATIVLGNNEELEGEELIQPTNFPNNTMLPLISPGASRDISTSMCSPGSLENIPDVRGKIVVCIGNGGEQTVKNAGGVAMIVIVMTNSTELQANMLPGSHLNYSESRKLVDYIKSTPNPVAKIIFQGTILGIRDAPTVAFFSSRGPNLPSLGILKPDICGPGVNILGAWNSLEEHSRFNVISGTSMSCPHLSGVAALLKQSHPNWSPAAIKSALMTSAHIENLNNQLIMDHQGLPASLFAVGAGHVNPLGANDPGLIYDIHPNDYLFYLCGLNYTEKQIRMIVPNHEVKCSRDNNITEAQLNYPTFVVDLLESGSNKVVQSRTVTNVGEASSTYKAIIEKSSDQIEIHVSPSQLVFTKLNQKLTYTITFSRSSNATASIKAANYTDAAILWTDGKHRVRSRISIKLANNATKSLAVMDRTPLLSIILLVLVKLIFFRLI